jgi:signal transduction histidine kinase
VRFAVERPGPCGPLPDEAGQHLEQVLREALSNTARHAGACRVRVSLVLAPDEVDLVVADDGCGPGGVANGNGDGQGLRNMRERARRLGGRLVVEPAPGGGTRVTLAVPLDSEEPEADSPPPPHPTREVRTP